MLILSFLFLFFCTLSLILTQQLEKSLKNDWFVTFFEIDICQFWVRLGYKHMLQCIRVL